MLTNAIYSKNGLSAEGGIDLLPLEPAEARSMGESLHLALFAMDHCAEAVLWMRPDGRLFNVNAEACRVLGYKREELLQRSVQELAPGFAPHLWTQHWHTIQQNRQVSLETILLTKTGQQIPVEIRAYLVRFGDQAYQCAFARDLTEKKQIERKTKAYEVRLGMSQRMEALGTLAGGIAHDFNNILATILGYTELSMEGFPKEAPQRDYLREVMAAGIRARDLVHQILSFSRQSEHALQPLQFKTIAKEALKLLRASIPSTIDIRANISSDALVMADAGHLHQIVMNLCSNAAQAMPPEGGVISVSLENVALDTEYAAKNPGVEPGRYLQWKVFGIGKAADPGSPESADSFFSPPGCGDGTSLTTIRDIVSEYGGHMFEERPIDGGRSVSVFLPLVERCERSPSEPEEKLPTGTGKEHVLVVDDEAPVARMVTMMLERLRYQVTALSSSIEALALFREKPAQFDLVITDLTMPNLPGLKLAAELKKIRSDIPIILCTGYSGEISEAKAAKTGIQATILKPIDKAELAKAVRALLDKAKASLTAC